MLVLIGQSILIAAISSAITTALVLKISGACKAARDIRAAIFWEKELRQMDIFKDQEVARR